MTPYKIGIDLGGTKIEIIALNAEGDELQRSRITTPQDDYPGILKSIRQLILDCEHQLDIKASIGIGTPGAISRATGLLKNSNSTCLNNKPIKQDIERLLERPVRISNDANCFALSEAVDGAAMNQHTVFGVILGTGVGAGVLIKQQPLTGPNAIAGEWGHNPLPWPGSNELLGRPCYCGQTGCIETWLSGPGMCADHFDHTSNMLESREIVEQAAQGVEACQATLNRYNDRLARSLAHVINILDPDAIVLGGGMGQIDSLYREIPRLWESYIFSDRVDTLLLPPMHGDSSGVRGAAWLWNN
ncbi:MAG: ROK family protein [Gammaproteobacteria bacterium]|nr:ROK family protein [Gammaproteobacteria bacterium]